MARNKRDHDHSAFRPEDEIDELFGGANPNPERIGCPGGDVLLAAARKALPMEHAAYDHLTECSECYREFRQLQGRPNRRTSWVYTAAGIAAVVAMAIIGGTYGMRGIGQRSTGVQAVVLDYQQERTSRSESGDTPRKPNTLLRKKVDATILMPTGSEAGAYEIRLVDSDGKVMLTQGAPGAMEDHAVRVRFNLDLQSIPMGTYSLELRRLGEDWDPHPVIIR